MTDDKNLAGSAGVAAEVERMLELLDRLAAGERLDDAPLAMGLSEGDARSIFAKAGLIVRQSVQPAPKRWPVRASLLDWREMSVAEALEILGNLPAKTKTAGKD